MSILSRDLAAAEPVHIIFSSNMLHLIVSFSERQKISPSVSGEIFFWLLYCAIAIVRLCAHTIIIYNDIHARTEPAGILQKIRV